MSIALSGLAGRQPTTLSVGFYNTHLFGSTGKFDGQETGLHFCDDERADQIELKMRHCLPDVFGLCEVWDKAQARRLGCGLLDVYPSQHTGPSAGGIGDLVAHLRRARPRLASLVDHRAADIVKAIGQTRYQEEGRTVGLMKRLKNLVGENTIAWVLHQLAGHPVPWGSGLMLFSRYPMIARFFLKHPKVADYERFAFKGVLGAILQLSPESFVTVMVTHLQEGTSPAAVEARVAQARQILQVSEAISEVTPVVVMGDMNVHADSVLVTGANNIVMGPSAEYDRMFAHVGMIDSYRAVYPHAAQHPGFTYDPTHPMAEAFAGGRVAEPPMRLDLILASKGVEVLKSRVLVDEFRDPQGSFGLSDHHAVGAALSVHPSHPASEQLLQRISHNFYTS